MDGSNKRAGATLSGVLVVDKPHGMRSAAVVSIIKRSSGGARTGHAGTLDPLATGVLVLALGKATKSIDRIVATEKRYLTRIDLGAFTTTDDLEGERRDVDVPDPPDETTVRAALDRFIGTFDQRPPAFSAVKIGGRRAYKLARAGHDVTPKPRAVTIHAIEIVEYAWPELEIAVHCAKGVYIRSLARDLGETLGTGGHCIALRRTAVGPFTADDNVLFVVAPADGHVFTRKALAGVAALTEQAWQLPYSTRVDSVTNFQHSRADGDVLVVADLVRQPETLDDASLAAIRRVALDEPLLRGRLVSPRADVTAVNVTFGLPAQARDAATPGAATAARALARRIEASHPGLTVRVTGMLIMDAALTEVPIADMATLMPVMFFVVAVALTVLLRNPWLSFATLLVVAMSIATAMGVAGWLGMRLTPPSAAAPIIILTLALADCVHLLSTYLASRERGRALGAALVQALRVNIGPVVITSLTTVIAFAGLNFSASPPFRDLGNLVALGIGTALVLAVGFLPAALLVLPAGRPAAPVLGARRMRGLARRVIRHSRGLGLAVVGICVVLLANVPRNELNDEFVRYFATSVPFREATDFTHARLTGLYVMHYSLAAGRAGDAVDPRFLESIAHFAAWLRAQPEVVHVHAITDILARLNQNLHGDDRRFHRTPAERQLAAQVLLLYELSLPFGMSLDELLTADKSASRVSAALRPQSSHGLLDLEERARAWLAANAPRYRAEASGSALMFAHVGMRNIRSMLIGTLLVLVGISLLLVIALRSVKLGLLSLVPNLAPATMAFGVWGLTVGEVGMALSAAACMTLGIVVDNTVHFLAKYLHARRTAGRSPEDAVCYAFETVGPAMATTSTGLVLGFLVLLGSSFVPNADMGLLTVITLVFALVADALLLPALLLEFDRRAPGTVAAGD